MLINVPPKVVQQRLQLHDMTENDILDLLLLLKKNIEEELEESIGQVVRIVFFDDRPASRLPRWAAVAVWEAIEKQLTDCIGLDEI